MKEILFLISTLFLINLVSAQDKVDLMEIRSATRDSTSEYYHPKLVQEFLSAPEYISLAKGIYLYYGHLYSPGYKIFDFGKDKKEFGALFNKRKCAKAVLVGERILSENPVDMEMMGKMIFCYKNAGDLQKAQVLKGRLDVLYRVILSSGTGDSEELPYKVIAIGDEYLVMAGKGIKGLGRKSKMKESSTLDIWTMKDKDPHQGKSLYFEVLRNMDAMPKFDRK